MNKPVEAIERLRELYKHGYAWDDCCKTILAYLDSLPDEGHLVEWPKELTQERLEHFARCIENWQEKIADALRALAAIAPERKKRQYNLWVCGQAEPYAKPADWQPDRHHPFWRKVGGPVEIDE